MYEILNFFKQMLIRITQKIKLRQKKIYTENKEKYINKNIELMINKKILLLEILKNRKKNVVLM